MKCLVVQMQIQFMYLSRGDGMEENKINYWEVIEVIDDLLYAPDLFLENLEPKTIEAVEKAKKMLLRLKDMERKEYEEDK